MESLQTALSWARAASGDAAANKTRTSLGSSGDLGES